MLCSYPSLHDSSWGTFSCQVEQTKPRKDMCVLQHQGRRDNGRSWSPAPSLLTLGQPIAFFFLMVILFIQLLMAVLGLCCLHGLFSSCGERGLLFVVVLRFLTVVGSVGSRTRAQQLWCMGLVASETCGIFLDQGSNWCPLHWQADSYPLCHQGSLSLLLLLCPPASLVSQLVKNPPAMQETWVRSLGGKDPMEKGKATHSSFLAWRIPWITVHVIAKSWT